MADRCSVEIMIGGEIKRRDLAQLIEAADDDYTGLDWEGSSPYEIGVAAQTAHNEKKPLILNRHETVWGHFENLEATCRELGLRYQREYGACQGAWGEGIVFWEPGMDQPVEYCSADSNLMLPAQMIRDLKSSGQLDAKLDEMDRIEAFAFPLIIVEEECQQ